jgi:hypothetical protein
MGIEVQFKKFKNYMCRLGSSTQDGQHNQALWSVQKCSSSG